MLCIEFRKLNDANRVAHSGGIVVNLGLETRCPIFQPGEAAGQFMNMNRRENLLSWAEVVENFKFDGHKLFSGFFKNCTLFIPEDVRTPNIDNIV